MLTALAPRLRLFKHHAGVRVLSAGRFSTASDVKACLSDVPDGALSGKRVLVRVDFNVPQNKETKEVTDDTRITSALPTINYLRERGCKVVLCSHLGRPKGKRTPEFSLSPIGERLSTIIGEKVPFVDDCIGSTVETEVSKISDGGVILLENARFHKGEEKNEPEISKGLAQLADFYVNDAFGTAHRAHASTAGVVEYIKAKGGGAVAGFLLEKELKFLQQAVSAPERPFAAIVGGAKVSTKLPVLNSLMKSCDKILLGGAMIFTFYKSKGYQTGNSLVEPEQIDMAADILKRAEDLGVKIVLPDDVICAKEISETPIDVQCCSVEHIPDGLMGLDIGPASLVNFQNELLDCKTVVWNGPMGVFEIDAFADGTKLIARFLANQTDNQSMTSIVGGGDSVAAVQKWNFGSSMSHVSTGGGASLELLEGRELPGCQVLDSVDLYL